MNQNPEAFTLTGSAGALIRGDLYLPGADNTPLVVVVHGFKGFKNWGFFPWLGRQFAEAGLAAAVFNLSHCGVADNPETFERLDLFEADTWSKRVHDMQQVLSAARHGLLSDHRQPNPARLGIMGHSMGGGLAILTAARDEAVRSIVTLAGVNRANRLPMDAVRHALKSIGHVPIENARTGQIMRIGREFFDELEQHGAAFDIQAAAARVKCPWLLIHGGEDETVPLDEAHDLLERCEHAKLLTIEQTGHTFGAAHPFTAPAPELEQATAAAIAHFKATL